MKIETKITIGRDVNGNKVATLSPIGKRGFSVQTAGSLPKLHRMEQGDSIYPIIGDCHGYWREFKDWVKAHGTPRQKQIVDDCPLF